MSEPTPEHVDAVAHRLATMPGPTRGDRYARWLLTDPPEAVLDAMQDALVRAGRLREDATLAWDGEPSMGGQPHRKSTGQFPTVDQAAWALARFPRRGDLTNIRVERRLVTGWQEAPDE